MKFLRSLQLLCILSIATLLNPLQAEDEMSEILFLQGNDAFAKQDYDQAIQRYLQTISNGDNSPALHFNLGNAYFQKQAYGQAILHYEKSIALAPSNKDAQVNLLMAKKAAKLPTKEKSFVSSFTGLVSLTQWFTIITITFWSLIITFIAQCYWKLRPLFAKLIYTPLVVLFIASLSAIILSHNQSKRAIVLNNETPLFIAPAKSSAANTYTQQGEEVQVIKYHENYILCQTTNGTRGWAENTTIQKIWD